MQNRGLQVVGTILGFAALGFILVGCSSKRVDEEPVIEQGDRVEVPTGDSMATHRSDTLPRQRESIRATAMAECEGETCDAIVRGRMTLGLTQNGVMAATRTTPDAWRTRRRGSTVVMTPRSHVHPPEDALSKVVMVQLIDNQVARFAYREAQGIRLVEGGEDTTIQGRAEGLADRLIERGDEMVAAGRMEEALQYYDRADVLTQDRPMLSYKIAKVLEQQRRPAEALLRYRLFLHRLDMEKLRARGEIAANIAEAIAQARSRITVLERRVPEEQQRQE